MPVIDSQLDPRSQEFRDNADYHRSLVDELDRRLARAAEGGGPKAREKHVERGIKAQTAQPGQPPPMP
jgi:3-methylcrotonyl-CoA carboxylase beta subunit